MTFQYWEVLRGRESRFLPLVPIIVHGSSSARHMLALTDSGAEQNVFGMDVAEGLQLSLEGAQTVSVVGVGEHVNLGYLATIDLQLGSHRWTAPVIFSEAVNERAILGQAGFFAFFTVTFRYRQREIEVIRN